MPPKPRKNRRLSRPMPGTPIEKQRAYYARENERLRNNGSKWVYGLNANNDCYCLLAYGGEENAAKSAKKKG